VQNSGLNDLGLLTMLRTYSKNGEDWRGITQRYLDFMRTVYPHMVKNIDRWGKAIEHNVAIGSMRLAQNSGALSLKESARAYNCAFVAPTTFKDFSDISYLLCCGAGVGFSVESKYTEQLPCVGVGYTETILINDDKEGWADSWKQLLENPSVRFDYSLIRPAGAPLSSGGTASGHGVLKVAHEAIRALILPLQGQRLRSIDVADIVCHIAQSIVAGGVRRSALICLYDFDDTLMADFKGGDWFKDNLHRSKANISTIVVKESENVSSVIWSALNSAYGEPGIALVSSQASGNAGVNPCFEISLKNRSFCNLSEVIAPNCLDKDDFIYACKAAAFFGTLQAGLTNFNYIHEDWKKNAQEEALLGVSITGQAMATHLMTPDIIREGAEAVKAMNKQTAKTIGINPAKRLTCTKPSGTTSCVFGTTSGIHAAHGEYVVRRIRIAKLSSLGKKLLELYPINGDKYSFIQQDVYSESDMVLQFPCHYKNAIYRKDESAVELLERMKVVYENWVLPGHIEGDETNNVSLTVSVRPEEKEEVFGWMLKNQHCYRGISVLPYDGGDYPLLPFEEMERGEWGKYVAKYPKLDFTTLGIKADVQGSSACSGGQCEVT
jgi:ribonucleoside-triphosphate reductase (thioredoxin)